LKNKDIFELAVMIQKDGELEVQRETGDAFLLLPIFEEVIFKSEEIQKEIEFERSSRRILKDSSEYNEIVRKIMDLDYLPKNKLDIKKVKYISVRLLYALKGFY